MKTMRYLLVIMLLAAVALPGFAAEEDSIAAVYSFGRTGARLTNGFAVGDGSFVVTSIDFARETVDGKTTNIPYAVVVSRWTGDAYVAKVAAVDESRRLALLKLSTPAFPGLTIAGDKALGSARKTSIGDVLSGDDAGAKFSSEILGLKVTRKPVKFVIGSWRASKACVAEVGNHWWIFVSGVTPDEKIPDASVVVKRGTGVLGMFYRRVVVTGGTKPVTYYRSLPASELRAFLSKAGAGTTGTAGKKAGDAETAFQSMCLAFSASVSGSPVASDLALAATRVRPKSAPAYMLLGSALVAKGKAAEGAAAIETAISLDPGIPDGDLDLGNALAAAGKAELAEKSLRKAVAANPADTRAAVSLAELLINSGTKLEEALAIAKQAAAASPTNLQARLTYARAMKHNKDFDEAIAEIIAIQKIDPKWLDSRIALAATYEAAGKLDFAEMEYRKAIELAPSSQNTRLALIRLLVSSGKKDDARKELEALGKLKLDTDTADAVKKLESEIGK